MDEHLSSWYEKGKNWCTVLKKCCISSIPHSFFWERHILSLASTVNTEIKIAGFLALIFFFLLEFSYRFMIMDRFGRDLQKMYEENAKQFPHKTVLQLGLRVVSLKNTFCFLNLSSPCKCLCSVPLLCRVQVLWWADLGTAFQWLLFC